MRRTAAGGHGQAELTLDATEAANPEWAPWLRLLRRARAQDAAGWALDVGLPARRTEEAPLLHEAVIAVEESRATEWVGELLHAAAAASDDAAAFGDLRDLASEALALLESGTPVTDRSLQIITDRIRNDAYMQNRTYQTSLCLMYLDRLGDPADVPLIQALAVRLLVGQNGGAPVPEGCRSRERGRCR